MAVALLGCGLVLLGAFVSTRVDTDVSIELALAAAVFVIAATCGFLAYPHLAVAATVVVFALVPLLKWLTWSEVGGVKDLLVVAAGAAAVIVFALERRRPDRWVLILILALLGLYVVNIGGDHDGEWAHGTRLVGGPLVLLLAGLTFPEPQRTFRWAMGALVVTACVVAAYGIVQQIVGKYTLEDWGYSEQVRRLSSGQLRSFGTLDDPFAYAALLSFGVAAALFWMRRRPLAWGAALLMLAGLILSFVRTEGLVLVAIAAVALARREDGFRQNLAVAAVLVTVGVALALAGEASDPVPALGPGGTPEFEPTHGGSVSGRLAIWENALGDDPGGWLVGQGVGEFGTAAERAGDPVIPTGETAETRQAVDSGYVAAIADVGVIGLVVLLALLGRLILLAVRGARQGAIAGWVALALLVALLADALTRESFTGFPTGYLCLFLVGVSLAAARAEPRSSTRGTADTARRGGPQPRWGTRSKGLDFARR